MPNQRKPIGVISAVGRFPELVGFRNAQRCLKVRRSQPKVSLLILFDQKRVFEPGMRRQSEEVQRQTIAFLISPASPRYCRYAPKLVPNGANIAFGPDSPANGETAVSLLRAGSGYDATHREYYITGLGISVPAFRGTPSPLPCDPRSDRSASGPMLPDRATRGTH